MRAGGFPGNPGGLVVSIVKTAGARAPAHQARGRGRRTWRPTERTAGARMVPPGEGNEARGDGRRGVGVSHSTAEAGELSPRDPVEGRGHRQVAPLEGKTANTPRLGPVSTSRQRIAELTRQAVGMAVAIAWLPGPAGTRRRVAKLSVEEPDAAEPARPDLWGARVSNDPGLPDRRRGGVEYHRAVSESGAASLHPQTAPAPGYISPPSDHPHFWQRNPTAWPSCVRAYSSQPSLSSSSPHSGQHRIGLTPGWSCHVTSRSDSTC